MKRRNHQREGGIPRRVPMAAATVMIVLVVVIALAVHYAKPLLAGPALTELVVSGGSQHVQPPAIRSAVLSALGTGFFTTDVETVRTAVQAVPWVASAAVRRSWPHTLYIDIAEEVPVARWNGDGLMDAQGRVFVDSRDSVWSKLPMLSGPEGDEPDVLAQFNTFSSLLIPRGLSILQLTVDARGDSTLELNDGIEVRLGREESEPRLERFATVVLPTLSEKLATVAYVDMRYTNGFAVGWASPGVSPACPGHVGPDERPATDARAGLFTRDGSQKSCTAPADGHSNEVGPNV
ncbi:MAG: cell division protein FtsQ/DivIB [Gammaproteobacteria bacterium]